MATESDLRDLLQDPEPGDGGIDLDAVLRHVRRRRRPRVLLSAAGGALALAAVVVVPAVAITTLGSSSTSAISTQADSAGGNAAGADEAAAPFADPGLRDLCGALVSLAASTTSPIAVDVTPTAGTDVTVSLVFRNTSDTEVAGDVGQLRISVVDGTGAIRGSELATLPEAELTIPAGGSATSTLSLGLTDCMSGRGLPPGDYRVTVTTTIGGVDVAGSGTLTIS